MVRLFELIGMIWGCNRDDFEDFYGQCSDEGVWIVQ